MFGNRRSRKQQAERLAGQAWENLSAAVDSAGSSTRSARRRAAGLLDDTSVRVGSGAKEARRRANAAFDALSGKKPRRPWGLIALVAAIGAAFGWVATTFGRQLAPKKARKRAKFGEDYAEEGTFPEDVSSELLTRP
jgi:ElaB/YqjD/DUF883 family membrane-anchored ribosome-binding protein